MDVATLFCMSPVSPDIDRLRVSRMGILGRLIAFAAQLLRGGSLAFGRIDRIRRWLGVAIFLSRRVEEGALDAPRTFKRARKRAAERDAPDRESLDLDDDALDWVDAWLDGPRP